MYLRGDHSTKALSLREIKEIADKTRSLLVSNPRPDFDIVEAIERMASMPNHPWGQFKIWLHTVPDGEPLGKILIKKGSKTLVIDPEIWSDAKIGEPKSRYLLAHELGHVILHDHYVQPYSDEGGTVFLQEKSTEWQAHRFAEFFLVADEFLKVDEPLFRLATLFSVERDVVRTRLGFKAAHCSSICTGCGNSSFSVGKRKTVCDFCGELAL